MASEEQALWERVVVPFLPDMIAGEVRDWLVNEISGATHNLSEFVLRRWQKRAFDEQRLLIISMIEAEFLAYRHKAKRKREIPKIMQCLEPLVAAEARKHRARLHIRTLVAEYANGMAEAIVVDIVKRIKQSISSIDIGSSTSVTAKAGPSKTEPRKKNRSSTSNASLIARGIMTASPKPKKKRKNIDRSFIYIKESFSSEPVRWTTVVYSGGFETNRKRH